MSRYNDYGRDVSYRRHDGERPYDRGYRASGGNPGAHHAVHAVPAPMTAADRLRMLADQMDAMEAGRLPPDLTAELSHLLPPVAAPYAHTAPHFEPGYAPEPRHQLRDRDGPRYRPPDLHPSYRDRDREERPPPSARPTSAVADPDTRKPQRQQLPQAAYVQRQQFRWLLKTRIRQVRSAIGQLQAALCPRDKKVASKMPSPLAGVYCPAIVPDFLNVFKSKLDYEGLKCRKLTDLLRNECADFLSGMSDVHTQYWTEASSEVAKPSSGEVNAARRGTSGGGDPDISHSHHYIVNKCLLAVGYAAEDIGRVVFANPAPVPAPVTKVAKTKLAGTPAPTNDGAAATPQQDDEEVTIVSTSTAEAAAGEHAPSKRTRRSKKVRRSSREETPQTGAAASTSAAGTNDKAAAAQGAGPSAGAPKAPGTATTASAIASAAATLVTAGAAAAKESAGVPRVAEGMERGTDLDSVNPAAAEADAAVAVKLGVRDDGSVAVALGTASETPETAPGSPDVVDTADVDSGDAAEAPAATNDAEHAAPPVADDVMEATDTAAAENASAEAPAAEIETLPASEARVVRTAQLPDTDPVLPWSAASDPEHLDPCALSAMHAALLPALRDAIFARVAMCSTRPLFYKELPRKEKPVPPELKMQAPQQMLIKAFGLTDAETADLDPDARALAVSRSNAQAVLPKAWPAADVSDVFSTTLEIAAQETPTAVSGLSDLSTTQRRRLLALAALPHIVRALPDGRLVALTVAGDALPDAQIAVQRLRQCAFVCTLDALPWQHAALAATGRHDGAVCAPVVTVSGTLALPLAVVAQRMEKILGAKHARELLGAARTPTPAAFLTSSHACDIVELLPGDAVAPRLDPCTALRDLLEGHVIACAEALSLGNGARPNYRSMTVLRELRARYGFHFRPEFLGLAGVAECLGSLPDLLFTYPAPAKREWPLARPHHASLLRHLLLQTLRAAAAAQGDADAPASVTVGLDVLRTAYEEAYHSPHPARDAAAMCKAVEALGWQFAVEALEEEGSAAVRLEERADATPPRAGASGDQGRALWNFLHEAYVAGSCLALAPHTLPPVPKKGASKRPAEPPAAGAAKQARTNPAATPAAAHAPATHHAARRIAAKRDTPAASVVARRAPPRDTPYRPRADPAPQQPHRADRADRRASLPPHDRRGGGRPPSPAHRYAPRDDRDHSGSRYGNAAPPDRHRQAPHDRRRDASPPRYASGPPSGHRGYRGVPPDADWPPARTAPEPYVSMPAQPVPRYEEPRYAAEAPPRRAGYADGPAYVSRDAEPIPDVVYAPKPQTMLFEYEQPAARHADPAPPSVHYGSSASPGLRYRQPGDPIPRFEHDSGALYRHDDRGSGHGAADAHVGAYHGQDVYAAPAPAPGLGQGYTVSAAVGPGLVRGTPPDTTMAPAHGQQQAYAPPQGAVRYVVRQDGGGQPGYEQPQQQQQQTYVQQPQAGVRTYYMS